MGSRRNLIILAVGLLSLSSGGSWAADVLTQHNDNARTGANTAESVLTTKNVSPDKFGKLWTLYADGQVVAQPLYVSKLAVDVPAAPGVEAVKGTFNAVVIGTMHNTVYVYDADKENRGPDGKTRPLWARWLSSPRPGDKEKVDMWSTNDPEWGIVATPVVDPQKTTLWVTSWHREGNADFYMLHALDLKTGAQRGSVRVGGTPPNLARPCTLPSGFNPCSQKQRSALLLKDGVVYVGFGGTDNRISTDPSANPHGTLFAFDAATLQQRALWNSTPRGGNGGIWQSGQGPAADDTGHLYLVTGNGSFSADQPGGSDYGNSFVKLKLDGGAFKVEDYFTPCNQKWLDEKDLDFGSAGPLLIPGTTLTLTGGKEGVIYLLGRNNLGKYAGPGGPGCANPNVVQAFMGTALHTHGAGTTWGHIHSAPVFWKGPDGSRVYVWGENDRLRAFTLAAGKFSNPQQPVKSIYQPPDGMPGGMLSVSSNGTRSGSGIVWATVPLDGDANKNRGVQGMLIAVDAQNVSRQLWTSELAGQRDRLGLFAKFVPPTVAGGKVFVATYGDKEPLRIYGGNDRPRQLPANYYVAVYGILPPSHDDHTKPIVNQDADDVTVTKAVATTPLAFTTQGCVPADAGAVDCTAALGQKFGAPSLHSVIVPAGYNFAGCNLLTVTTASKQGGVTAATGIGWFASDATLADQAMTTGRFVRTGELKQVGSGQLKAGGPALLHQFVGVANCTVGQASLDKVFKPFMQFENSPDDKIFRNWDRAQNYRVSRATPQFDRSRDVLAP